MPFNSVTFIIFFLLFTSLYYYFNNTKVKTALLIIGSYLFFAYSNLFNLFFLLTTTGMTFVIANRLKHKRSNKFLLILSIIFILSQLVFTKYSAIIFKDFSAITFQGNQYFNFFILPIGISFYSLQAISLLVEINNRKYKGDISLKSISQFLSFFPQSIAGPIHRADELIPQFSLQNNFKPENIIIGFKTILWGYFCKLIVADKISLIITPIFSSFAEQKDGLSIFFATLLYSLQIYFDFWGYSLVAIGIGRVLGFTININFANPYAAKSFKDFWHKWHITLSKWMRDYIYIPIGGNKLKSYLLFCLSILITFLISGFWHGATFNFILWGTIHALLYLSENIIIRFFPRIETYKSLKIIWRISFFILLSMTWLIFRTNSVSELNKMLLKIVVISDWTLTNTINCYFTTINIIYLLILLITLIFTQTKHFRRLTIRIPVSTNDKLKDSIFVCLCIIMILLWGDIGGQEFLYFQF